MRQKNRVLTISNKFESYYLDPRNVLYVKADGNYCNIQLIDGDELKSIGFQRAEIARLIMETLSPEFRRMFAEVGRQYIVNLDHIMFINPQSRTLAFDINSPGTCKKFTIEASVDSLRALRDVIEDINQPRVREAGNHARKPKNGGFTEYIDNRNNEINYNITDDEILILG